MEFKDRLKQVRTGKNVSLTDLGAILGKTESACRAWELGRSKPDADTLVKLAEYFNCTTDYLLGISDSRNEKESDKIFASESELARCLEKVPSEMRIYLLTALSRSIEYSMRANSLEEQETIIRRFADIIAKYGDMVITSFSMKFSSRENPHDYIVFLRLFETGTRLLQEHRDALIQSAIGWWDDESGKRRLKSLIYGEDEPNGEKP